MTSPVRHRSDERVETAATQAASTCNQALRLAAAVHRFAVATPTATALVVDHREYSYADLAGAAARVAAWLRTTQGADCEPPRVGIVASRTFETFAALVGAAWAGGTGVPINPRQPAERLATVLRGAGLHALIVDSRGQSHLDDDKIAAVLPRFVLAPKRAAEFSTWERLPTAQLDPVPVADDHAAYVIHTSGTTGVPKGVVVTSANVNHFLARIRDLYALHPGDRVGQFCEPSFDLSVFEIYAALDAGASLHVVPETRLMAPAGFIREQQLTAWSSVPSVISILTRMKMLKAGLFPSLRISVFIGEALTVTAARAWQEAAPDSVVDNHYGPTEATVACTMQRLSDSDSVTAGRGTMSIGRPYDGMEVEVVDEDGCFLSPGQTGELALCGPQVAAGYLGDAELTARRFVSLDHPRLGPTRWYRTGDLGYRDESGLLHCLGRMDLQVKINGHRVELEDLDAHVRIAAGCAEVATIAWPVLDGHASGTVAFVCGSASSPSEVRDRLRELVPPYMLPRRVIALDALPLSANGKIDRKALAAMVDDEP